MGRFGFCNVHGELLVKDPDWTNSGKWPGPQETRPSDVTIQQLDAHIIFPFPGWFHYPQPPTFLLGIAG